MRKIWKDKFGDTKIVICELCCKTKVHKRKSFYSFREYIEGDIKHIKLECKKCFIKMMEKYKYNQEDDEKERFKPFLDINDMGECIDKMPKRFDLWNYKNNKKTSCLCKTCNKKIRKMTCFTWYIKLPLEGGSQEMDNFDLVCEDCQTFMICNKKSISSFE